MLDPEEGASTTSRNTGNCFPNRITLHVRRLALSIRQSALYWSYPQFAARISRCWYVDTVSELQLSIRSYCQVTEYISYFQTTSPVRCTRDTFIKFCYCSNIMLNSPKKLQHSSHAEHVVIFHSYLDVGILPSFGM
jgi:hypothetical protein